MRERTIINSSNKFFDLRLKELFRYKDLYFMLVKRDFVSFYKQTILGPLWYVIQPILTTAVYAIVFGLIAKLPTQGLPRLLFYMSGVVFWQYFSDCLSKTSNIFLLNQGVFGKVYFPRLLVPFSIVTSSLFKFFIQYVVFLIILLYYSGGEEITPSYGILLTPFFLVVLAATAMGFGLIMSSITTKYRDLAFLMSFGLQLLFYGTPIIYPFEIIPENVKWLIWYNPLVHVIEALRFVYTGAGKYDLLGLLYSFFIMLALLVVGVWIFTRTERRFLDTV